MFIKFLLLIFFSISFKGIAIEEGFVTFATQNYFPLMKVLLNSIKAFSTRPVVAFGINADVPFSEQEYPFLIKKRIDVNLKKVSIYYMKPRIILESGIEHGIYVEADDFVNKNIDELFAKTYDVDALPLCPIHPNDPTEHSLLPLMQALGVTKKTMHYVHGHVVFSNKCMPFIQEWYNACLRLGNIGHDFDETILNILLWKYNANRYLPLYDLYFKGLYDLIDHGSIDQINQYYMFHGGKNALEAQKLLDTLIKIHHQ